ncbi:anaphase promoting complex subunit 2 [Aspergillus stella-maris]|uniref:anaphase promoting complex subunit 2 n=1 Tax=Aspergillus stella-maris TaxID=1810926 RepID=UPI003CCDF2E0
MVISDSSICAGRSHIFGSIFAPAVSNDNDLRTGLAPTTRSSSPQKGALSEDEKWDRAWSAATDFLLIRDRELDDLVGHIEDSEGDYLKTWRQKKPLKETKDALGYLIKRTLKDPEHAPRDIFDWYGAEIRRHFLQNFKEALSGIVQSQYDRNNLLEGLIVKCLLLMRKIYFTPLVEYLLPYMGSSGQERIFMKFQRSFRLMIGYAMPWPHLSDLLFRSLTKHALDILGISSLNEANDSDSVDEMDVDKQFSMSYQEWRDAPSAEVRSQMMTEFENARVTTARDHLLSLLNNLQLVGLGGEKAQEVFAGVMDTMLTEFIRAAYTSHWEGPSLASLHLRQWITDVFGRLAVQVLAVINTSEFGVKDPEKMDVKFSDVEKWQEVGIARLGALRVGELFDVIVEWPASSGAIEDLRHFTTHPAARHHLTHSFIATLNRRLLHPGASTVEILQVYISIIRSFNLLDPKGVLLDRIARPIRRYLRDRDDTVKAIVGGLLADPADADGRSASSNNETLVELSAELSKAHQNSLRNDSGELDWDDMNWMPDPVDAAPDYRKSKSSDVIGSLISLFESKETFVREMQNMLAERLLQKRADFEQEMSVLELLKLRFGDNALQACEVMLRDIFDSRRVDTVVRNDQGMTATAQDEETPNLHAKILSHFFWPEIQGQQFKVPNEITDLQKQYSEGFESLKQSRKLTWLNGLGQVTVELDLEDRVFVEEVTTWQATVIYAFNTPSNSHEPVTKSTTDLASTLDMSAALVRSACLFWVSRRILTEVQRDTFRVLETLPTSTKDTNAMATDDETAAAGASSQAVDVDSADAAANAEAAAAAAAKESAEAAAMEKMNLYWQFIVGMLTNQGAMPLQRIVMMLKIAVPGGFPFSNEELREFLAGMVSKGKVEIVSGGNYKIVR